jgi:dihydroorotase
MKQLPPASRFEPLMTLYLTDDLTPAEIERAKHSGVVHGVKLYPKGATTNSQAGVDSVAALAPVLEALERHALPLLVHGEVTRPDCDVFDREPAFIDEVLEPLLARHAGLRVVFEHITTKRAVQFVRDAPDRVAATITPQHLLLDRNALFEGGLRPHLFCLPVLKRTGDQRALLDAATSGEPRFFLGTDSAPHVRSSKETACGCAGIYSAPVAIELYAEAFARAGAMAALEGFASHHGPDFYGLPRNSDRIRLVRSNAAAPTVEGEGGDALVIFRPADSLQYCLADLA